MTFVPVHELLAACVRQPWALGAYDTFNLEMTQGIMDATVVERSPLIIMMLPGFMPAADWPGVIASSGRSRSHRVPVGDHWIIARHSNRWSGGSGSASPGSCSTRPACHLGERPP